MSTREDDWGASNLRSKVNPTNVDRDPELKTMMGTIGEGHQPAGKDNVADRGPGQRVGRAETKFTKRVPTP